MILIIFTNQNEAIYQKSTLYLVWKGEILKVSPERPQRKLRGHVPDSSFLIWMILIICTNQNKAAYQNPALYLAKKGEISKLSPERPPRKLRGCVLGS